MDRRAFRYSALMNKGVRREDRTFSNHEIIKTHKVIGNMTPPLCLETGL